MPASDRSSRPGAAFAAGLSPSSERASQTNMYEEEVELDGNVSRMQHVVGRKWQHWLDISAPHITGRWALAAVIMLIYSIRVYFINGERFQWLHSMLITRSA